MKKIKRIVFFIAVLIIIGGYSFLRFKLGSLLAIRLSRSLHRPVNIGKIDLSLPFSLSIKNLVILDLPSEKEDPKFLRVEEIKFTPAIIPFLKGKIFLYSLIIDRPQLKIVRISKDKFNFSDAFVFQKAESGKGISLLVSRFKINKGELNFIDRTADENPLNLFFKNVNFSLYKLAFPLTDIATDYVLEANLGRKDGEGSAEINSSGWINFTRKDMEGRFSLNNLDYLNVKPYLGEAISGKISQGIINFYAHAYSQANDLSLKCKLELEKIFAEESSSKIFGISFEKIIEAFKDKEGKISFDFEMRTKLDQPRIDYAKIGEEIWKKITDKLASKVPSLISEEGVKK